MHFIALFLGFSFILTFSPSNVDIVICPSEPELISKGGHCVVYELTVLRIFVQCYFALIDIGNY
jgi:hypothetical protein